MARHGENIYQRKDGRYEGRYVLGKKPNGQTRFGYVYGRKYVEVQRLLLQKKAEHIHSSGLQPVVRLQEWAAFWLENEVLGCVKPSTFQVYRNQMEKHILPYFHNLTLPQLTPPMIYEFLKKTGSGWFVSNHNQKHFPFAVRCSAFCGRRRPNREKPLSKNQAAFAAAPGTTGADARRTGKVTGLVHGRVARYAVLVYRDASGRGLCS